MFTSPRAISPAFLEDFTVKGIFTAAQVSVLPQSLIKKRASGSRPGQGQ